MTDLRMHADEVHTDVPLVRRLLAAQFPQWADLPLERVPSGGTDRDTNPFLANIARHLIREVLAE